MGGQCWSSRVEYSTSIQCSQCNELWAKERRGTFKALQKSSSQGGESVARLFRWVPSCSPIIEYQFIATVSSKNLDSSLKRHTAFIKRIRQSAGSDNRDQLLKDIDTLSLEKYVDEIAGAAVEGITRCKTEKDVWSAVEVRLSASCKPRSDR